MTRSEMRSDDEMARIRYAVERMREWADEHPEADTQGLDDEEWSWLAIAALHVDVHTPRYEAARARGLSHLEALRVSP